MTTATAAPRTLPLDRQRGTWGMALFIATEASLFGVLFFAYYFLAAQNPTWPLGEAPKLRLALIMTVILVSSSVVLHRGEKALDHGRHVRARTALALTLLLGVVFMVIQTLEYSHHLKTLKPTDNAYGSIFYTITTFHALHLLIGMGMLTFVLLLPRLRPAEHTPYRAMHNAALYWHFVDAVWLLILTLLYVIPNLRR